jgi:hypothetical protein
MLSNSSIFAAHSANRGAQPRGDLPQGKIVEQDLPQFLIDLFLIFGCLALVASVAAALGEAGLPFGFDVFPIGEDNNWVDMLQRGGGSSPAHLLWALDQRNPLSPWWYIAARDLILNFDHGLLVLRYAMAVLLALSAYFMVVTVAGRQSRSFALALAVVIVFWMANRYLEQIIWNFQGALCASLVSVAAYAQFVNGGKRSYLLYGTSIVTWFIAFATYTIQCGAVLAIGYLALRRGMSSKHDPNQPQSALKVASIAVCDTIPYLALFGVFLLVWQTTIRPSVADSIAMSFSPAAFAASLGEGLIRMDLGLFFSRVQNSPYLGLITIVAAGCGILIALALWLWTRKNIARTIISIPSLLDVFIILACLAAPTVVLESSASMWPPGTRWPMIYQLTTPAILLACGAAVVALTVRAGWGRQLAWIAVVGVAVGAGEFFSLGHNQIQVEITRNEKFIRDSILRLVAEDLARGDPQPEQVLLKLDADARAKWRSSDILSPTLARVWLRRDDISFRLIPWIPAPNSYWASWWKIQFGADWEGVGNAKVGGGSVPYQRIRILQVSEGTARRAAIVHRSDLNGWQVDWNREGAVRFPVDPTRLCPLTWTVDQDVLSAGWSVPERDNRGPVRWTTSSVAQVILPPACADHAILRVVVAYAVSMTNIEGLVLRANGQTLRHRRQVVDGNQVYEAELPQQVFSKGQILRLDLAVRKLDKVEQSKERQFGVAVRMIEIRPF